MIRKISETRALAGHIVNEYNDSQTSAYSTEYINDMMDYSTSEVNTGKKWIDGKTIYRKVLEYSKPANESNSNIPHGISNMDWLIRAEAMSKIGDHFRPLPSFFSSDISTYNQSIYYVDSTIVAMYYSSWYAARTSKIYVVLEYTKSN